MKIDFFHSPEKFQTLLPPSSFRRDPSTLLYHCPSPGCEKRFRYSSRLLRHLSAHQRKRHRCHTCQKLFSRGDVLLTHLAKVHGEGNKVNVKKKE